MPIIEGSYGNLQYAGTPASGVSEIDTLTFGGTITGGDFKLGFQSGVTASIAWSNVNATLVGLIDAALEALPNVGTGNATTAVGTMTAGIGTITITFAGTLANADVGPITIAANTLTGTAPTLTAATTTAGSAAGGAGAPKGALLQDTTNGILYINTGTAAVPTWTKVGTQT
jgi:hypothetical protein